MNEAKVQLNNRFEQYQKDVTIFNQGNVGKFNQADLIKRQAELTRLSLDLKQNFLIIVIK